MIRWLSHLLLHSQPQPPNAFLQLFTGVRAPYGHKRPDPKVFPSCSSLQIRYFWKLFLEAIRLDAFSASQILSRPISLLTLCPPALRSENDDCMFTSLFNSLFAHALLFKILPMVPKRKPQPSSLAFQIPASNCHHPILLPPQSQPQNYTTHPSSNPQPGRPAPEDPKPPS